MDDVLFSDTTAITLYQYALKYLSNAMTIASFSSFMIVCIVMISFPVSIEGSSTYKRAYRAKNSGSLSKSKLKNNRQNASIILRKNIKNNSRKSCASKDAAHHIIPYALLVHRAMTKCGNIDINEADNGICIPKNNRKNRTTVHRGNHREYSKNVERCMNKIPRSMSRTSTCKMVMNIQNHFSQKLARNEYPLYGPDAAKSWNDCPKHFK